MLFLFLSSVTAMLFPALWQLLASAGIEFSVGYKPIEISNPTFIALMLI